MDDIWEDLEWAQNSYSELQNKYQDEWVAIVNKEVVSSGKNLKTVEEEARRKTGKREVYTTFVESGAALY